ncbi:hypothetical protein [Bradyrhizobium sp. 87]|uniref:hypothetical protein n=1 Tax=Bradyrhizobium sp. 87 TaxID=2782682 RepID=UPI001FF85959|nr:hypothetical protein [Bradyrhizobium sp. 87]MCK1430907.1 hypothetical protein [Bradyrhizobium sp. 87]
MFKRLCLAFAGLFVLASSAIAAGTIPGISMTQQLDQFAHPLSGGQLYFIQAGTTSTPQSCYQDTALTLAWPNPITLDASGRVPQVFCADGNIKIRLTDRNGVQQIVQDNLLVVGPSGGGGGGGTVDPTTILATGDFKLVYNTGVVTGFVRCNGRTIGSATSGATERANADTSALFSFLWGADANLAVSGGRGASAAADWAANKTIALPDTRNSVLAGLGDMGNSDRALFSGVTFTSGNSTTLGSSLGGARSTLVTANLPPYTPTGTIVTTINNPAPAILQFPAQTSNTVGVGGSFTGGSFVQPPSLSSSFTGTAQGGTSTPVAVVQPTILTTIYIKL